MKKVIIIISIIIALIAIGSVFFLDRLGDVVIGSAIETELKSVEAEIDKGIEESEKEIAEDIEEEVIQDKSDDKANKYMANQEQTVEPDNSAKEKERASAQDKDSGNKVSSKETSKKQEPKIVVQKINEIKDEVTVKDKVTAATMVLSNLSTSEIDELKDMLSGGVTAEEKKRAKEIAYRNFTAEEIKKIKELYRKYMKK